VGNLPSDVLLREMPSNQFQEGSHSPSHDGASFDVVWGVHVTARFINNEIGFGCFALTDLPPEIKVTNYDGPRCNPDTGKVLFECPHTLSVEQSFPTRWRRSGKWGPYERSHCILVKRLATSNTCIDGSFSAQPFLFSEPYHGGIGFGALLNSGTSSGTDPSSNVVLIWRRDPNLPEDPNGVLDQVQCDITRVCRCACN